MHCNICSCWQHGFGNCARFLIEASFKQRQRSSCDASRSQRKTSVELFLPHIQIGIPVSRGACFVEGMWCTFLPNSFAFYSGPHIASTFTTALRRWESAGKVGGGIFIIALQWQRIGRHCVAINPLRWHRRRY